jgi:hypothetical protein
MARATFTIFQAALEQFGKQIVNEMRKILARNNNDNTGRLSNSIQATVEGEDLQIDMLGYGKFVNDGAERRAGKAPPLRPIIDWISKNGISPRGTITAKQLPYVIQASIAKKGQTRRRAYPFIEPAIENVLNTDLDNIFGKAIEQQIDLIFTDLKSK